jgi:hypothetical protein
MSDEDIHRRTPRTHTGHAGAQGHSTGTVHVSRLCPGSPGDRYVSFYRYRYRYRCFRVCPGSPRCLFTGTGQFFLPVPVQYCTGCPGSPGVFLPVPGTGSVLTCGVSGVGCWWVSMVVRFVCVVCVPLCVRVFRVSRVCPGSPRCLFTGSVFLPVAHRAAYRYCTCCVCDEGTHRVAVKSQRFELVQAELELPCMCI